MTLPPSSDQRLWPAAPGGARNARSASGGYVPPPAGGEEPATTRLPRVQIEQPPSYPQNGYLGGHAADRFAGEAVAGRLAGEAVAGRFAGEAVADRLAGEAVADRFAGDPAADQFPGDPAADQFAPDPAADQVAGAHRAPDQLMAGHEDDEARPAGRHSADRPSALRLVWIYPDLLSTYGDRGNLIMLARRARLRGLDVEATGVNSDQPVPREGDVYLLGGGEDLPQVLAAQRLRVDGGLSAAAARGAVVFAVCAGYQLIGSVFGGAQGEPVEGLGILDVSSGRGERRGVGEILADVDPALGIGRLTGFENHQGVTRTGPGACPLARTLAGIGNGDGTEGAYAGHVLGTYLHGPALVRNPGLADLLLGWAVGSPLQPLPDSEEAWTSRLRAERLAAVAV